MPDFRLVAQQNSSFIAMDWAQTPNNLVDETQSLITAVNVALLTDSLAAPSDKLPDPNATDRRGWWGDLDADTIWGGWPIGSKLWLLKRAKIVDAGAREGATTARVQSYIQACLQPFVTAQIVSSFTIAVTQVGVQQIDAKIVLYRGAKQSISLQYQALWSELFPNGA